MQQLRKTFFMLGSVVLVAGCDMSTATGTTSSGPYYTITTDLKDSAIYPAGASLSVPVHITHDGIAVSGATPRWAILSGDGVISDTISTTDTLGAAHIVWTLGRTPAMNTLIVGFGDAVDTLYATGVVGAPSSLFVVGSQTITISSGDSAALRVVVKDRPGNVVANATVAWTSSGGALSASTTVTDSTGIATTSFSASAPGTYYVTADLPALATCIFEIVVR